jgi:hypothetical protein
LHIAARELWLLDHIVLPFGSAGHLGFAIFGASPMRKLLILPIILLLASTGCQSLRRVEVWKQQTFFSPSAATQPVAAPAMSAAPMMTAPAPFVSTPGPVPVTVGFPAVDEPSQQETILPGPVETISPGPIEDGPVL